MPSIIVTGGAGYIGSHTCKALAMAGFSPVALDDLSRGNRDAVKWGPLVEADVRNGLAAAVVSSRPVGIIHCAAWSDVAESCRRPAEYSDNNVGSTGAVVKTGLPFVLSSSAAVYQSSRRALAETAPLAPVNPYGQSKLECERLAVASLSLRYFNVAGADPDGEVGENKRPATHLVTRILESIRKKSPFLVNGDGSCVRDFVHVSDVAAANVTSMLAVLEDQKTGPINICSGFGHSILDVIEECERVVGQKVLFRRVPARKGDPSNLVGSPARAAEYLNWRPERSLETQISTAWEWMTRD